MRFFSFLSVALIGAFSMTSITGMETFDHTSCFTCDAMRSAYAELERVSPKELVKKFKLCCVNAASIDRDIKTQLLNVAKNEAGRETLRLVVARLYPFVVCASSLEELSNSIPTTEQSDPELLFNKVKNVVLLCDGLGFSQEEVFFSLLNIDTKLNKLKSAPVVFPAPLEGITKGKLLKVFKDDTHRDLYDKKEYIVNEINLWWDEYVKRAIDRILPILREGMFSLVRGASTRYSYNKENHTFSISLSSVNPTINARCIVGPLICNEIESEVIPICYFLDDKKVLPDSGIHHEIFHHLVIGLELDAEPFFRKLAHLLKGNVDGSYIVRLKDIYTDMDEFRNIIGIFVKDGEFYFDPCSESAYLCKAGKYLRGTHKSKASSMVYIPITFVQFLQKSVPGLRLKREEKLMSVPKLKWC